MASATMTIARILFHSCALKLVSRYYKSFRGSCQREGSGSETNVFVFDALGTEGVILDRIEP